jgi:putative ABC transport system substrate-binding protein
MPVGRANRRTFITGLGSAAAWPMVGRAQQPGKAYRIGFLANDPTIPKQPAGQAFLDGLHESGFIEGKNIIIERRFAEGRAERYSIVATELVQLGVDVIVASTDEAAFAAKQATKSVPIVILNVVDPIAEGLVAGLAHPGGNVTGLMQEDSAEVSTKRLQLLKDAVPRITQVAVLMNPDLPVNQVQWQHLDAAARSLKLMLRQAVARQADDFKDAFAGVDRDRCDALFLATSVLNFLNRRTIVQLAAASQLPVMSTWREATQAGGVMSYGFLRTDQFHAAAIYVGKILKGANPAELPVEAPTKYELVINLNTAKVLNLELPRSLLLIADEVIE